MFLKPNLMLQADFSFKIYICKCIEILNNIFETNVVVGMLFQHVV